MKKVLLVVAVVGLSMASCKKDYTCTCKDTDTVNPGSDVVIKGTAKKKDADKVCDAANTTYSSAGYSCKISY